MGSTYIIYRKEYSEKAQKFYGSGWTWIPVVTTKLRPPSDEKGFHLFLWDLIKDKGAGDYRITRTAVERERRGFHPVWMGSINQDQLTTDRRYTQFKGVPSLPPSRDFYFKKRQGRTRFSKPGKHISSGRGKLRFK